MIFFVVLNTLKINKLTLCFFQGFDRKIISERHPTQKVQTEHKHFKIIQFFQMLAQLSLEQNANL